MKKSLVILVGLLTLIVLVLCVIMLLAIPRDWPLTSGTIQIKLVELDGERFLRIEGQGMNYVGQMQALSVDYNEETKRIILNRVLAYWSPFTSPPKSDGWPHMYPVTDLKPGNYTVVYKTKDGEATAGRIEIK